MSPIVPITEVEQLRGRGRDTQGKKATNKNRLRVMPPGSLAIANNRMRQQKKPSAAQRAVTAIQKVPSAVQKAQPVKAATPVQEPPSHVATLVQAPPSQAATPVKTPPPTTTSEAFRFIPTPGFTLSRQFQQGPPEHTTHDIQRDHRHQEDDQEHEERNQEVDEEGEIEEDGEEDNHDKDTCGKVIIRPMCNGFTPADVAAAAIRRVIEKTFPDNITCYSEVKDKARELWFKNFGKFVSWEPHHEHNDYQQRMTQATQTDDGVTSVTQEVDGSEKIQIWKDVSGGKSRGRCYGVGHLAPNLRYGVTHLTDEADAHHIRVENQKIEAARAEAARARADAEAAKADAAVARADAAAANANYKSLETKFEEFQRRMMALESGSCSGHSRHSSHPHYDNELDDQSVDEEEDGGL
ncbi:hypothetical protein P8452_05774 [Trifolium repens]|nr:hypothetical protein P8452_05774 [Trifolium repens]